MEKEHARGAPPVYTGIDASTFNRRPSLLTLSKQLSISPFFASQLHILQEYVSIRIVIDDSGSMRTTEMDAFGRRHGTRWDELLLTLRSVFDIACASARSGATTADDTITAEQAAESQIDVFLLNGHDDGRKEFLGLSSYAELEQHLASLPVRGGTPTLQRFTELFSPDKMSVIAERPVLTCLFTDGQPDCGIEVFGERLRTIQTTYSNSFVTIALCTEDDRLVSSYNKLDVIIPRVDVMDDYNSEKKEILCHQGRTFPFSKSDYLVKMLLGSRIELWDRLDERRLTKAQRKIFENYSAKTFGMKSQSSNNSCIIS